MTENSKEKSIRLHKALGELLEGYVADHLSEGAVSKQPILKLIRWSYHKTQQNENNQNKSRIGTTNV